MMSFQAILKNIFQASMPILHRSRHMSFRSFGNLIRSKDINDLLTLIETPTFISVLSHPARSAAGLWSTGLHVSIQKKDKRLLIRIPSLCGRSTKREIADIDKKSHRGDIDRFQPTNRWKVTYVIPLPIPQIQSLRQEL
jgi:hypothetical protein